MRNLEAMAPVEDAYDEAEDMMLESKDDEHSAGQRATNGRQEVRGDSFSM